MTIKIEAAQRLLSAGMDAEQEKKYILHTIKALEEDMNLAMNQLKKSKSPADTEFLVKKLTEMRSYLSKLTLSLRDVYK
jgi:hypothetical protein